MSNPNTLQTFKFRRKVIFNEIMDNLTFFSMFMLGILGTGHCIGMCGPLVIAFPARGGGFVSHLYYHLGRIVTYTIIGSVMGGIGVGLAEIATVTGGNYPVWVTRIQMGASIVAAFFLLMFGLARLGIIREPGWMNLASPNKIPGYRKLLKSALASKREAEMLLIGLMMGLLPCGLSFAAFSRALPSGSPIHGAAMVFIFALGTLPGLLLLGTGASGFARRYQTHSDILAGLLMIFMAAELAVKALSTIIS
jgi:sulfite exporter TauE/SafE